MAVVRTTADAYKLFASEPFQSSHDNKTTWRFYPLDVYCQSALSHSDCTQHLDFKLTGKNCKATEDNAHRKGGAKRAADSKFKDGCGILYDILSTVFKRQVCLGSALSPPRKTFTVMRRCARLKNRGGRCGSQVPCHTLSHLSPIINRLTTRT